MPATGNTRVPISLGTSTTKVGEKARLDLIYSPAYLARKGALRVRVATLIA